LQGIRAQFDSFTSYCGMTCLEATIALSSVRGAKRAEGAQLNREIRTIARRQSLARRTCTCSMGDTLEPPREDGDRRPIIDIMGDLNLQSLLRRDTITYQKEALATGDDGSEMSPKGNSPN
jgi:hypothetical protein